MMRIFRPKMEEIIESWRKLHNEELHNMYSSPSMIRIIKSKMMKWSGHVARMGKINACRILPVVLYGCETWSLTLREEHRLKVFENRVLRRIFGPKRDEVTGGWSELHNEELHNLYSSPSIIRMIKSRSIRRAGHVARMGRRGMHIGYWWKSPKERALGRPRCR
jgi:hypothetical protein